MIKRNKKGFTLIELLVVISIISVLASVVFASLSSARAKGTAAAIKSNLRNMVVEMELSYSDNGNYSGIINPITNTTYPDTTCIGGVVKMAQAIINSGATVRCLSYYFPSAFDVYLRWGASALKGKSAPIQAWSSSNTGVVTWDEKGVNSSGVFVSPDTIMKWDDAIIACALAGGRLPTLEELKTLSDAMFVASGSNVPPGFVTGSNYYSSNILPNSPTAAWVVNTGGGAIYSVTKTNPYYVHCVR